VTQMISVRPIESEPKSIS